MPAGVASLQHEFSGETQKGRELSRIGAFGSLAG